tara:strand:- start:6685 stop:8073 length:1389 start_codon:yes stop_codon:yes gene_type:complete
MTRTLRGGPRTLLARVMIGVLSLLALGGVVVAIATFEYGRSAARQSFDRLLVGAAQDIAESISISDGAPLVDLPVSAFSLLSLAADDRIFYAVHETDGSLLTGYAGFDLRGVAQQDLTQPAFFDGRMQQEPARFVTVARPFAERAYSGRIFVTVGQTLRARSALALDLTTRALMLTGAVGIVLLVSAFLVIRSAMRPLEGLTAELSRRDPYDLTPMSTGGPAEMAVMVQAMNRFMFRLDRQVGAMKNLISDTAHQLRTPVAAIRAQAELALEDDEDNRAQRLQRMVRRTRSLGTLLDQMLSRALVIHRTENAAPTPVDLRDIALGVFESVEDDPEAQVQLSIGDQPVMVMADEISMGEAVKNMLANALRHGVAPVVIGVSGEGAHSEIWVQDAGGGPPADVLTTMGRRFERSAASKGNSAGLGLSIVRAVTEAFDGQMHMGRVAEGFRVTLTFPADAEGGPV